MLLRRNVDVRRNFENNTSEEEKYIANIVALQEDDIDEPILQLQSPQVYENSSPREIEENTKKKSKVIDENSPKIYH